MQIWEKTKQNLVVVFVFLDCWFFQTFVLKKLKKKCEAWHSPEKNKLNEADTIYFILAKKTKEKQLQEDTVCFYLAEMFSTQIFLSAC
jgi:regulatory protein YycI of two-component signal transduction system YycFG